MISGHAVENRGRQPARLGPEQECVTSDEFWVEERTRPLRRQRKYARFPQNVEAARKILVFFDGRHLAIIEACTPDPSLVQGKAERVNQMQGRADIGAQTDDIARVWWDFRLIQDQVEHDN